MVDPALCRHDAVDHGGSSKIVQRTYCKDHGTYIDTVSQSKHKDIKEMRSVILDPGRHDTGSSFLAKVMNHERVSETGVMATIRSLAQQVESPQEMRSASC